MKSDHVYDNFAIDKVEYQTVDSTRAMMHGAIW